MWLVPKAGVQKRREVGKESREQSKDVLMEDASEERVSPQSPSHASQPTRARQSEERNGGGYIDICEDVVACICIGAQTPCF
jgi:hypothetical protein